MNSVTINGEKVYPTELIKFIQTPIGLKKTLDWLESQRVNHKPSKGSKK